MFLQLCCGVRLLLHMCKRKVVATHGDFTIAGSFVQDG
jgi:hypothetical protein